VLHVPAVDVAQHAVEHPGQVRAGVVHAVGGELARGAAHTHVAVGQRQQGLAAGLHGRVEALEDQPPGVVSPRPEVQLGDVVEHHVGAGAVEPLPGAVPVHAHHEAEAAGRPGLHTGHGVLDHHAVLGRHAQQPGALEERVRCGLARQAVLGGPVAVHDPVEGVLQPGRGQHHRAVAARGHEPHRDPALA